MAKEQRRGRKIAMDSGSGRHAWLRLVPEKVSSWDFRKLYTDGRWLLPSP